MPRPKKETFPWDPRLKRYRKQIKDADGKYFAVYGKTEAELAEKLAAIRAAVEEEKKYEGNPLVRDYAEKWAQTKTAGMKERNAAIYKDAIRLHINPVIGDLYVRDVKPEQAEAVLAAMAGKSASLQGKVLNTLRGIFEAAEENEYIKKNPCKNLKNKGYKAKEKEALSDQEAQTLLEAVRGTRAELFVLLGLYTGMRREEILGLKWDCVHLDAPAPYIEVRRSLIWPKGTQPFVSNELKTGAASRKIPLPDVLLNQLCGIKGEPNHHVIGPQPYSRTQFFNLWKIVRRRQTGETSYRAEKNGKTERITFTRGLGEKSRGGNFLYTIDFSVSPHILRHTYITNLVLGGTDIKTVQYLAGHSDPKITLKIYTHIKGRQPEDLIDQINKVFQAKNQAKTV